MSRGDFFIQHLGEKVSCKLQALSWGKGDGARKGELQALGQGRGDQWIPDQVRNDNNQ